MEGVLLMAETNQYCSYPEDLDAVSEAGKILMESGAEIYRIEETMKHMAASLKIKQFNAYVVNRGIIVSGTNCKGDREARVTSVPETEINLSKIEAVNSLSREIENKDNVSAFEIFNELNRIDNLADPPLLNILMAYFIGAGCFSYAIGSTVRDSLSSAVIGFIMALILQWVSGYIKTKVLLAIIGSSIVTLSANLLCLAGIGQHRSLIILGALMLIIPGAAFTNSVREFSQNNHTTGLTLLMSALLTCISISFGVALTIDLLPFAEQMTGMFSDNISGFEEVIARTIMAGLGTVAFSFLFHATRKYYLDLGALGATSWLIYLILKLNFQFEIANIFIPALFAALASRLLSVKRRCPITIFLSTSIFPLIPGLSFYRAVYYLMTRELDLAWANMLGCFNSAFAIALSIIIIREVKFKIKR